MFNKNSDGVTKPAPSDRDGKPMAKREESSQRASRLPGDNAGAPPPATVPLQKSPSS